jgi:mycolipenoyl-CoA---2-(long-chain-fatty acyl)-trehalose mycolipenoyltransferase / long-chain-acyl-CoA---trehalose acyltransferase
MVAIKGIRDWSGGPGQVTSWHPSPVSRKKVADAPVSPVPVSYQQAQHLRGFRGHVANGTDMARLNIPAWDIEGKCDIRAMSHVINAYIRRHDTYHSWFELGDDSEILRRTVTNPKDIKFVPTEHGSMSEQEWQDHVLATPDPWQWDCFNFGIIQRADHFTFYVSVDHVHTDVMFMGMILLEIHMMYAALVGGSAPLQLPEAGRYADYCRRQQEYTAGLTLASPEVLAWIDFAEANGGGLPRFSQPLGDHSESTMGELLTVELLDKRQSDEFEAVCAENGARFSGGVFACAAIVEREFTGCDTYQVVTPTTTRRSPAEFMTTGWFTGLVPIVVPVDRASFGATVRAAQRSFDEGLPLADVPFERVVELAADSDRALRDPGAGVAMLSFLDAGAPPLSPSIIAEWEAMNGCVFWDSRAANQVGMWVNRKGDTSVTIAYPKNPVARASVARYAEALKRVYRAVADRTLPVATLATADVVVG